MFVIYSCIMYRLIKQVFYILFLLIFTASRGFCINDYTGITDGKELSVDECIEIAVSNNPNIKKYKNFLAVEKSQRGQTRSNYFPTLGLTTGYFLQTRSEPSGTDKYYALNLSANQLIWDFGKTTAKLNMHKYNITAAGYDVDNAIAESIYDVRTAYYNALMKLAAMYIAERSVKINKLHVERAKALYYEGLKSKIDLVNAEVYLTDAETIYQNSISDYEAARYVLDNTMYIKNPPRYELKMPKGFDIRNDYLLSFDDIEKKRADDDGEILTSGIRVINILNDYDYPRLDKTVEECLESAESKNPSLLTLKLAEKASQESLKVVRRMNYPSLSAGVGYTHRNTHEIINNGFSVNAQLDIGQINPMLIKYQIDEAKYLVDIAKNNIDIRSADLHFLVKDQYGKLLSYDKLIPLKRRAVDETLENFKLADGRYTVGTGTFIELQEAHSKYNEAQLQYVKTVFDYHITLFTLLYAMGVR